MPDETMQDREQAIRERAYAIWIEEGRPEGRDAEHWDMASAALDEEEAATTPLTDLGGSPATLVPPTR